MYTNIRTHSVWTPNATQTYYEILYVCTLPCPSRLEHAQSVCVPVAVEESESQRPAQGVFAKL